MTRALIVAEGDHELGGALKTLVRRLAVMPMACDTRKVSDRSLPALHGIGRGYFKRAVQWMQFATKNACDVLILVIDQDNQPERRRQFDEAQEYVKIPIRRALGVAVPTFDAWILADEKALASVLGCPVSRQGDPEEMSDPKHICIELLTRSGATIGGRRMYAEVAELVDVSILVARCPKGFGPFAERVGRL